MLVNAATAVIPTWSEECEASAPIRDIRDGDHDCEEHLDHRRAAPPNPRQSMLDHNGRMSATPGPNRKFWPVVVNSGFAKKLRQTVYPALCLCIPCWHATDHDRDLARQPPASLPAAFPSQQTAGPLKAAAGGTSMTAETAWFSSASPPWYVRLHPATR